MIILCTNVCKHAKSRFKKLFVPLPQSMCLFPTENEAGIAQKRFAIVL